MLHKISTAGLEVDQTKGGYHKNSLATYNSKEFSKISRPLCKLLEKDARFYFNESCRSAFKDIKSILLTAPIMVILD